MERRSLTLRRCVVRPTNDANYV